jgi:23S rRNA pseudouridine955/2504/2580 synthase
MSGVIQVIVSADEDGIRIDRWFKRHYPGLSHGQLEKRLRKGEIRLSGKRVKANDRVEEGQEIRIPPLDQALTAPKPGGAKAVKAAPLTEEEVAELRARVLYKDDHVLVINKPEGLAVQGGSKTPKHLDGMLDVLKFDHHERPRLVHRLDKDTSGVLVLARTVKAASLLTEAFKTKEVRKIYWAAVVGTPKMPKGVVSAALAKQPGASGEKVVHDEEFGKRAVTNYQVVDKAGKSASWLVMEPVTGRTHQLRVHALVLETPIVGDGKYGGAEAFSLGSELSSKMHLHARGIQFRSPSGKLVQAFAPIPAHMEATWSFLGFEPSDELGSDFSIFDA